MILEITNGNFRNCTHPTFMGNSEVNGCKWPSRFCFLATRKVRWTPLLKYLKKLKQFRGSCKNRILLVRFIIFQTQFSKGILTFVGPWRQCRVSLLTMVNGLPKNWIGTLHNLKKYFGILDYALRVFSKGFPLYEILLNISTLYQVSTRPTSNW